MKRAIRRAFDSHGNVKTPGTVFEAEEAGAIAIYLRCMDCGHRGEISLVTLDPEAYVPDIGIGRICSACKCDEIESWPRYRVSPPPKPIPHAEYLRLAESYGIREDYEATLARLK
jgi:hypothetical protein